MNYQDLLDTVTDCDGDVIIVQNMVVVRPSLKKSATESIQRITFGCFDDESLTRIQSEFGPQRIAVNTPTIIRHAQTEGSAAVVIAYYEPNGNRIAVFQHYDVGLPDDTTIPNDDHVWVTEQDAVKEFEEWRAREIGDMPGNL